MQLLLFLVALGCTSPDETDEGTWVGNPGEMTARLAPGDELFFEEAGTVLIGASFLACDEDGEDRDALLLEPMDLLGGNYLEIPGGAYCEALLFADISIYLAGEADDGGTGTFAMEIPIGEIVFASYGFEVDANQLIFELGVPGWINPEDLGLEDGEHQDHDFESSVAGDAGAFLTGLSQIFEDDDGDGEVSDAERDDNGPLAVTWELEEEWPEGDPNSDDDDEDPDDGSCSAVGGVGMGFFAVLISMVSLRRRR